VVLLRQSPVNLVDELLKATSNEKEKESDSTLGKNLRKLEHPVGDSGNLKISLLETWNLISAPPGKCLDKK